MTQEQEERNVTKWMMNHRTGLTAHVDAQRGDKSAMFRRISTPSKPRRQRRDRVRARAPHGSPHDSGRNGASLDVTISQYFTGVTNGNGSELSRAAEQQAATVGAHGRYSHIIQEDAAARKQLGLLGKGGKGKGKGKGRSKGKEGKEGKGGRLTKKTTPNDSFQPLGFDYPESSSESDDMFG